MRNQVVTTAMVLAYLSLAPSAILAQADRGGVGVERLLDRPIITPDLHPSIGPNIQGPSLIKVPDWVAGRLGVTYLLFADHKGRYIRLPMPMSCSVPGAFIFRQPSACRFVSVDGPTDRAGR